MAMTMRDIMVPAPVCLTMVDSVHTAAQAMHDHGTSAVLVLMDGTLSGLVTDYDIAAQVLAGNRDPHTTRVGEICRRDVAVLGPGDSVATAARLMLEDAVRRIAIIDDGIPVGLVCVGDLHPEPASTSALSAVAAAPAGW